jgi:23S rRNA pseudouridine2605 synthase
LTEGRNREVRRLFESQGLTVSRLKRVRFGSFFIPSAVKAGKFVDIEGKDVLELYRLAGLMPPNDSPSSAKAGPRLSKAGKLSAR